jgi:type IV pilus assembly protein PilP
MRAGLILVSCASVMLTGCFGDDQAELREWMDATRKDTPIRVDKVSKPKDFAPFEYRVDGRIEPFDAVKLTNLLQRLAEKNTKGKKPDMERRREALEAYPMDSLKMVGVMQKEKLTYALIMADQTLHQVKIGNYIGQNFGMITKISETEIFIKELAQDAAGDWVERDATLQLQEGGK